MFLAEKWQFIRNTIFLLHLFDHDTPGTAWRHQCSLVPDKIQTTLGSGLRHTPPVDLLQEANLASTI